MLPDVEEEGREKYQIDIGVPFTAIGGPRWMENAPHLHRWGDHLTAVKRPGEDLREGRIPMAVQGRHADFTGLQAPVDVRHGNKKRSGPQGNDHRLAES
jgi:hypothetical protein